MVLTDSELEWDLYDLEMADNRTYGDNDVHVNTMSVGDKRLWVSVKYERNLCLGMY